MSRRLAVLQSTIQISPWPFNLTNAFASNAVRPDGPGRQHRCSVLRYLPIDGAGYLVNAPLCRSDLMCARKRTSSVSLNGCP